MFHEFHGRLRDSRLARGMLIIGSVVAVIAAGLAAVPAAGADTSTGSQTTGAPPPAAGKKGVAVGPFAKLADTLKDSGAGWYWNWASSNQDTRAAAEFVPNIWGAGSVTDQELAAAKASGTALLGFNEPDLAEQANMTVEQALDLWPRLQETGLRLGSPGVAANADVQGSWLDRFMAGAAERKLKVDFLAIHWYGADFSDRSTDQLMGYLKAVNDKYHLPIWLTEFGLINYTGEPEFPTSEQLSAFVTKTTAALESTTYVERYSWPFLLAKDKFQAIGLYHEDGTPTAAGTAFKAAGPAQSGGPASIPTSGAQQLPDPPAQPQPETRTTEPQAPGTQPTAQQPTAQQPTAQQPTGQQPTAQQPPNRAVQTDEQLETQMIGLINNERELAGCSPMNKSDELTAAARTRSAWMAGRRTWEHGSGFGQRPSFSGYRWWAYRQSAPPGAGADPMTAMYGRHDTTQNVTGFMEDPDHRNAILNCSNEQVGVGVARDADNSPWWTQVFATQTHPGGPRW
jgi:uncharacterized protein YkwD